MLKGCLQHVYSFSASLVKVMTLTHSPNVAVFVVEDKPTFYAPFLYFVRRIASQLSTTEKQSFSLLWDMFYPVSTRLTTTTTFYYKQERTVEACA